MKSERNNIIAILNGYRRELHNGISESMTEEQKVARRNEIHSLLNRLDEINKTLKEYSYNEL